GTPLCGERIYDRPLHGKPLPDASGFTRAALHAQFLGFKHPATGKWVEWTAPLPADMTALIARLRARQGDKERRQGDKETRRQGERMRSYQKKKFVRALLYRAVSLSPCLLVSLSGLLAAGCSGRSAKEPIIIGRLVPLTGSSERVGKQFRQGIDLALKEANG